MSFKQLSHWKGPVKYDCSKVKAKGNHRAAVLGGFPALAQTLTALPFITASVHLSYG